MHPLLLYLLKLSVGLALVYLFYQMVLRKLTFYTWNRWYLLVYTGLCFLVPFINISPVLKENQWADNNIVNWVPVILSGQQTDSAKKAISISMSQVLLIILVTGILIMLVRLLIQFISFRKMMRKAIYISGDEMKLYQVNENIVPFSFGNAVFINKNLHTDSELQEIIRHEFVHIRQRHSADILWSEVLCLLNWFNPFVWLLKKSIRQNLEFIADNHVLENGMDKKAYQYLLLKVTGNNQYSIATPFNFSSLKKRIAMMNKLKSARVNLLRFLFILPLLAVILLAFRQHGDTATQKKKAVQLMPAFNHADTIPDVTTQNNKGYVINIKDNKGNCMVVIKDKKGKEVKRLLLTEWNEKADYYEGLYGQIPPPPPPPPAPPVPPAPPAPGGITEVPLSPLAPVEVVGYARPAAPSVPPAPPAPVVEVVGRKSISATAVPIGELPLNVLYIINNKKATVQEVQQLSPNTIQAVNVLKNESATNKYGDAGKNGVVEIQTKAQANTNLREEVMIVETPKLTLTKPLEEVMIAGRPMSASTKPVEEVVVTGRYTFPKSEGTPLIILDGQEVNAAKLNEILPASIESINVLKDKTATDLYGQKGKNGVLIIKTKTKLPAKPITTSPFFGVQPKDC